MFPTVDIKKSCTRIYQVVYPIIYRLSTKVMQDFFHPPYFFRQGVRARAVEKVQRQLADLAEEPERSELVKLQLKRQASWSG